MAMFSGAVLFGTGLGPIAGGWMVEHLTWRWIFWLQTIVDAVLMVVVWICFKETRGNVLLSRKAKALNAWYEAREAAGYYNFDMPCTSDPSKPRTPQRIRWRVKADEERATLRTMIAISLFRPFHLLFTEPVVFFFSLWVSFSWAILYLTLGAIPLIFETNHGFSIGQANSIFAFMCAAGALFTPVCIYQEKLARRSGKLPDGPEERLYFACFQSIFMPIGMFMFGWTSFSSIHWVVPGLAIGIATIGIFSICTSRPFPFPKPLTTQKQEDTNPDANRPRHLQLPRRRLPPLRQLSARRAILLPQRHWRLLPACHRPHVPPAVVWRRVQPARRHRHRADPRAVGPCFLRPPDPRQEQVCE